MELQHKHIQGNKKPSHLYQDLLSIACNVNFGCILFICLFVFMGKKLFIRSSLFYMPFIGPLANSLSIELLGQDICEYDLINNESHHLFGIMVLVWLSCVQIT